MASAALASTMNSIQAVGVFVGIPLVICGVVALAVYVPHWCRRRRAIGTFRARKAEGPITSGVLLKHHDNQSVQEDRSAPSTTTDDEEAPQ